MQSIEKSDFEKLNRRLEWILKQATEERKNLIEQLGEMALKEIQTQISQKLPHTDTRERKWQKKYISASGGLADWQEKYIGSRGGYAAVRAKGSRDGGGTGPNSAGAVTNYNENGHTTRPGGAAAYFRRKRSGGTKQMYIEGRHFYRDAEERVEKQSVGMAEDFVRQIGEALEG